MSSAGYLVTFKRRTNCGLAEKTISLRNSDVSQVKLAFIFSLHKESIYLTTEQEEVIFHLNFATEQVGDGVFNPSDLYGGK